MDQVSYRTGGCLLRSLRLSGLIGSSLEVVRVSAGEVLCSRSGVVAVAASEIVIPAGEVLRSCSGAWHHVGAFIPL